MAISFQSDEEVLPKLRDRHLAAVHHHSYYVFMTACATLSNGGSSLGLPGRAARSRSRFGIVSLMEMVFRQGRAR